MNARRIICNAAVFVTMIFVTGCATTSAEHRAGAADALVEIRDGLQHTRLQIDETLASLNSLMKAPPSSLKENYSEFAKNVDNMTREAARMQKHEQQMRERSAAWLSQWAKGGADISDPELRKISGERRSVMMSRIQTTNDAFRTAHLTLDPFVANLQDIKKVVGTDLTPNGVAAVSSSEIVRNANANGAAAARSIDVAAVEFQPLLDALTPSTK